MPRVAVVGAGIAGAACASTLREAGVIVDVYERGRAPGGRLASPRLHGRRVDLGAAYFTVTDDGFASLVEDWVRRGRIREWTDTLDAFSDGGHVRKGGPMRWAAPDGLRSLVHDLLTDAPGVLLGAEVHSLDDLDHDAVVLAMPDLQAARLAGGVVDWVDYEPVIAVAAGWPERCWDIQNAAFVNDDADIALIADDGARRGDGAAVLVAHTTASLAWRCLDAPDAAIEAVLDAVRRTLGVKGRPDWTHAHRWSFAKPVGTHGDEPFALLEVADRPLGMCGDSWCPSGAPRVEAAWLSGRRLGADLVRRLGES